MCAHLHAPIEVDESRSSSCSVDASTHLRCSVARAAPDDWQSLFSFRLLWSIEDAFAYPLLRSRCGCGTLRRRESWGVYRSRVTATASAVSRAPLTETSWPAVATTRRYSGVCRISPSSTVHVVRCNCLVPLVLCLRFGVEKRGRRPRRRGWTRAVLQTNLKRDLVL